MEFGELREGRNRVCGFGGRRTFDAPKRRGGRYLYGHGGIAL